MRKYSILNVALSQIFTYETQNLTIQPAGLAGLPSLALANVARLCVPLAVF